MKNSPPNGIKEQLYMNFYLAFGNNLSKIALYWPHLAKDSMFSCGDLLFNDWGQSEVFTPMGIIPPTTSTLSYIQRCEFSVLIPYFKLLM